MAERACLRDAFGRELQQLGRERSDLVVLDGDLADATNTGLFGNEFPDRYFDMGISEQDMMGTAAGLASCGKLPLAATFAVFAAMRACEQVRTSICYPRLNVKIVATHSGLSAGPTGPSHQGTEDLAIMRALPNMTVLSPADAPSTRAALRAMLAHDGPVYMRLPRAPLPVLHAGPLALSIGRAITLRDGTDVALIATGVMVGRALEAAAALQPLGVQARVIDMHTIKPIDDETVVRAARETGRIVTLEDHNILGGLGGAVAEAVTQRQPVPVLRLGVPDCYGWVGSHDELLDRAGLGVPTIVARVRDFCGR